MVYSQNVPINLMDDRIMIFHWVIISITFFI